MTLPRLGMKNACEFKEQYGKDGKCLKREITVGPVVIWGLIVIVALLLGKPLSVGLWSLIKP